MQHHHAIDFKNQFHEEISCQRNIQTLLNCYIREFAQPAQQLSIFNSPDTHLPQALKASTGQILAVQLPHLNAMIVVKTGRRQMLGQCRFLSAPYLKLKGRDWQRLFFSDLARLLLRSLAVANHNVINLELFTQIINSLNNTRTFMVCNSSNQQNKRDVFIRAEQQLIWGHSWHPTPKSRSGISDEDLVSYSPETGASFQLVYLAVKKAYLSRCFIDHHDPFTITRTLLPWPLSDEYALLPCHPWQLKRFAQEPLFMAALEERIVINLGTQGEMFFPTSSVRTLYQPGFDYFIKSSLHVRLTNCVRKNAWYELSSAVNLTRLIKHLPVPDHPLLNHFHLMHENAAMTLDLQALQQRKGMTGATHLSEVFGLIFRTGFSQQQLQQQQPMMAATLFAEDLHRNMPLYQQLKQHAATQRQRYNTVARNWFECYLNGLVSPVLYYFFELGVVFEPHLQNIVVGFEQGFPCAVYYRDMEGTKLLPELWPEHTLAEWSKQERSSVYYTRAKGWQRVSYCLLVNNISEAIYALSEHDAALEQTLWQLVADQLRQYQQQFGPQPELQALLTGERIPCKTNFTTRLLQKPDKQSGYILLDNPFANIDRRNHPRSDIQPVTENANA